MTEDGGVLERSLVPFNEETFNEYCHIGDVTRAIFQKAKEDNEQPNTFARIPQVLYRGSINTKNLDIVEF